MVYKNRDTRLMVDQIQGFKILNGYSNIDPNIFWVN